MLLHFYIQIAIVCLDIAVVVVYRIWVTKIVFPDQAVASLFIGTIGSTILNTVLSLTMTQASLKIIY